MPGGAADHVGLAGDWSLWRDFAVRSTGFRIAGLEVFGGARRGGAARRGCPRSGLPRGARLAEPRLAGARGRQARRGDARAALTGQAPADVVARYWQRYCSKNDTIGFFGPLGWGRFTEEGEAIEARVGAVRRRAGRAFRDLGRRGCRLAAGDRALSRWARFPSATCAHGSRGNGRRRPGGARPARGGARRGRGGRAGRLSRALDALDRVFEELTGRPAVRGEGDSSGGRTVAYLDCMRDLD